MEILERTKGESGDLVPFNADEKEVREEVNRRTCKAGLTTKYGECPRATKIQVCGGLGKTKLNIWPRDADGNLID